MEHLSAFRHADAGTACPLLPAGAREGRASLKGRGGQEYDLTQQSYTNR